MKNTEFRDLARAFEEASAISLSLVALPVLFLFLGVFLDKTFSTTPLFIIAGIIVGVAAGFWRVNTISKKYKFKELKKKVNK